MTTEGTRAWAIDVGLLVLRVGLGAMMMAHGWPKMAGGAEKWARLGGAMEHLGVTVWPTFWGFCAASAELFGGALLAVGLFTRPAAAALAFTMFVAFWMHLTKGDDFTSWSHSAEDGIAFVALLVAGAGRLSLDDVLLRRLRSR